MRKGLIEAVALVPPSIPMLSSRCFSFDIPGDRNDPSPGDHGSSMVAVTGTVRGSSGPLARVPGAHHRRASGRSTPAGE